MRRLALAALLAACAAPAPSVRVAALPAAYAASMSSTPGIGLTPAFEAPRGSRWRWSAAGGRLLTWDESTREISEHGKSLTTLASTVYWSYDPASPPKSPVRVEAVCLSDSGEPLARASVELDWDGELFRVRK